MSALTAPSLLALFVGNPSWESADRSSFARVVLEYPARGGNHRIPAGEYLLAQLVASCPAGAPIRGLRLDQFSSAARAQYGIPDRAFVTILVTITYQADGKEHAFTYESRDRRVGWALHGYDNAIPGTPLRPTDDVFFHDQLRPLLDEIAARFGEQLKRDLGQIRNTSPA